MPNFEKLLRALDKTRDTQQQQELTEAQENQRRMAAEKSEAEAVAKLFDQLISAAKHDGALKKFLRILWQDADPGQEFKEGGFFEGGKRKLVTKKKTPFQLKFTRSGIEDNDPGHEQLNGSPVLKVGCTIHGYHDIELGIAFKSRTDHRVKYLVKKNQYTKGDSPFYEFDTVDTLIDFAVENQHLFS